MEQAELATVTDGHVMDWPVTDGHVARVSLNEKIILSITQSLTNIKVLYNLIISF